MPSFLLNRWTMALYNKRRFARYQDKNLKEVVDFANFFHPLDSINNWNRLYGKRGFYQYQCLLPDNELIERHLHELLNFIQQRNLFSFLAVIKFHRQGKGYLTFSQPGFSVALDFPNTKRVRKLLPELNKLVTQQGGRIYLAKDALLDDKLFRSMYAETYQEWETVLQDVDPEHRFQSKMSQRLQWK